jgi:Family of unknown function (DUF5984)
MTQFSIQFGLADVKDIQPWGNPGEHRLHWFGLTDGKYCIDTPKGQLFSTSDVISSGAASWVNYYVARLFEDLVLNWPVIAEPIPDDIVFGFKDWHRRNSATLGSSTNASLAVAVNEWSNSHQEAATPENSSRISEAVNWAWERQHDTSYLHAGPNFYLWRVGDRLFLSWQADDPWRVTSCEIELPFSDVQIAVTDFTNRFFAAMEKRVETIRKSGWQRKDCVLDVGGLVVEHEQRWRQAEETLRSNHTTDWDEVRRGMQHFNLV